MTLLRITCIPCSESAKVEHCQQSQNGQEENISPKKDISARAEQQSNEQHGYAPIFFREKLEEREYDGSEESGILMGR